MLDVALDVEHRTSNIERRTKDSSSRAFTLAEVLITMLFLAIILPVAMHGASLSTMAASNARHTRQATSLAQEKLHELTTMMMLSGAQSGDFAPDHPEYRWTSQTLSAGYGLYQLDLRVSWLDRNREMGVNVSTVFRPYSLTTTTGEEETEAAP